MSKLTKEDFYFGALVSYLINKKAKPALFGDTDDNSRRIYDFTTDNNDGVIYAKYCAKSTSSNLRWQFVYNDKECEKILELLQYKKLYLAFICGQDPLKDSQLAVFDTSEQKLLLDNCTKTGKMTIIVKSEHGKFYLDIKGMEGNSSQVSIKKDFEI